MRILVAYEERHRAYRDTIAEVLGSLRPQARVEVSALEDLQKTISWLDPHVVIANSPNVADPGGRPAWFELPAEPDNSAGLCVGGEYRELVNPGLDTLLEHVDEAERLARQGEELGGC